MTKFGTVTQVGICIFLGSQPRPILRGGALHPPNFFGTHLCLYNLTYSNQIWYNITHGEGVLLGVSHIPSEGVGRWVPASPKFLGPFTYVQTV